MHTGVPKGGASPPSAPRHPPFGGCRNFVGGYRSLAINVRCLSNVDSSVTRSQGCACHYLVCQGALPHAAGVTQSIRRMTTIGATIVGWPKWYKVTCPACAKRVNLEWCASGLFNLNEEAMVVCCTCKASLCSAKPADVHLSSESWGANGPIWKSVLKTAPTGKPPITAESQTPGSMDLGKVEVFQPGKATERTYTKLKQRLTLGRRSSKSRMASLKRGVSTIGHSTVTGLFGSPSETESHRKSGCMSGQPESGSLDPRGMNSQISSPVLLAPPDEQIGSTDTEGSE